jgi:flagellar protein FliO/FliZ
MSVDLYTRFLLALIAVVVLLAAFAFIARRLGLAGRATGGKRRLAIIEVTPLDGKRRLVLLRRDDTEHLVLLSGESATVIESGIAAPATAPTFADLVEEQQK